jgi:hypothetical protein
VQQQRDDYLNFIIITARRADFCVERHSTDFLLNYCETIQLNFNWTPTLVQKIIENAALAERTMWQKTHYRARRALRAMQKERGFLSPPDTKVELLRFTPHVSTSFYPPFH